MKKGLIVSGINDIIHKFFVENEIDISKKKYSELSNNIFYYFDESISKNKKVITYNHLHEWVNKKWKKPNVCEICNREKRLDWACISRNYDREKRNEWMALCRSCHIKIDMTDITRKRMSEGQKNKKSSIERKCRKCGNTFMIRHSQMKRGHGAGTYCSNHCRSIARKGGDET